jgi:chlorite dismutase
MSRLFTFTGGDQGPWSVTITRSVVGESLPGVKRLDIVLGAPPAAGEFAWRLRGITSNQRYVTSSENEQLVARQVALGRPTSERAALIPIRKNAAWWALPQDERRAVLERSSHIELGLKYLPAVARRLHHCRDLSEAEPFDFLTLFDYSEADSQAFEELVEALRATEEWRYVDREVDVRLAR